MSSATFRPIYADAWMNETGHGMDYHLGASWRRHYDAQTDGAREQGGTDDFLVGQFDLNGNLVDLTSAHGSDLRDGGWDDDSYRAVAAGLGVEWVGAA